MGKAAAQFYLDSLPNDSVEIANDLKKENIKGFKGNNNPLAKKLSLLVKKQVFASENIATPYDFSWIIRLPLYARQFVVMFNKGLFPEMEVKNDV